MTARPLGKMRVIYSSAPNCVEREYGGKVTAFVGPIGNHTDHPEFQQALEMLCMAFNRRQGLLSASNHRGLTRDKDEAFKLLREALNP